MEKRMPSATVTSKGQITIPKSVRELLGLNAGDRVSFTVSEDGVVEMQPENVDLNSLEGFLKPRTRVSLEEMDEAVAEGAAGGEVEDS